MTAVVKIEHENGAYKLLICDEVGEHPVEVPLTDQQAMELDTAFDKFYDGN
jgi:hypothetical protein